jgi:predicted dinucleotide-binding enzyme
VAEQVLDACGAGAPDGKTVIDTTNPIADAPPVNGAATVHRPNGRSWSGCRRACPRWFVGVLVRGQRADGEPEVAGGLKPTMFMCGNDAAAKAQVQEVLAKFGWEWEDWGARARAAHRAARQPVVHPRLAERPGTRVLW